jgi:hypothetical protein
MNVSDGVDMWRKYMEPLKSFNVRLGAPAPTNAPDGKRWLQSFMSECDGCTIDFIVVRSCHLPTPYVNVAHSHFMAQITTISIPTTSSST